MRNVVVVEYLSVDGRMEMEDPEGADESQRGGWTAPYWDDDLSKIQYDQLFASDALLLGRVTYEGFAATWPSVTDEVGFADRMNTLPKFVASTSLKEPLAWNASLLTGDVPHEVMTLKEQPGQDILVYGSGTLVQFLIEHELVDVCRLMVHPILLGRGKRLFEDDGVRGALTVTDTTTTSKGVVVVTYQPA
jgi:dihydrofolate reductase